ncbi:hypothetical protein NRF20_01140 [Streptomyces sp. R-74717]|uniref:hypothetical protein n=1 Tax=Streptomyces TaxID=1883 RepID=UPI0037B86F80
MLLARVEEAAAGGEDSPLQNMLAMLAVACRSAANGKPGVAATALGYCETIALNLQPLLLAAPGDCPALLLVLLVLPHGGSRVQRSIRTNQTAHGCCSCSRPAPAGAAAGNCCSLHGCPAACREHSSQGGSTAAACSARTHAAHLRVSL